MAFRVGEYATPVDPDGKEVVAIARGAGVLVCEDDVDWLVMPHPQVAARSRTNATTGTRRTPGSRLGLADNGFLPNPGAVSEVQKTME